MCGIKKFENIGNYLQCINKNIIYESMNHPYIDELINRNRIGKLAQLIQLNVHNWSINNFQYIFEKCIKCNLYDIFHFMMEHFIANEHIYFNHDILVIKNMWTSNIFYQACGRGFLGIVKYLARDNIVINTSCGSSIIGKFAHHYAYTNNRIDVLKYLMLSRIIVKYPKLDRHKNSSTLSMTYLFS